MEEGLEPHEVIERTVEHHHHEEGHRHESAEKRFLMLAAVAAAVLAVLAALGSLLSGHAANQAILSQTQAADKWAYFQAKSTKGHLYEVSKEVVASLGASVGSVGAPGKAIETFGRFQEQADKYDREKRTIQEEAEHLEQESRDEFHKHQQFAFGIAAFQVGIVLASVSIMVRYRALLVLSGLAGLAGIVFLALGLLTSAPPKPTGSEERISESNGIPGLTDRGTLVVRVRSGSFRCLCSAGPVRLAGFGVETYNSGGFEPKPRGSLRS